jgi:8-hydroxy-5-deazaflavin:NADPH oxidoreductase
VVTGAEAARDKDLIVVTIPEKDVPQLPAGLFAEAAGSVVVDTGNYYPRQRDGQIEPIESGLPESRWVEQQLGHPAIKTFNNIYARSFSPAFDRRLSTSFGRNTDAPRTLSLVPCAGDAPQREKEARDVRTLCEVVFQEGRPNAGRPDADW